MRCCLVVFVILAFARCGGRALKLKLLKPSTWRLSNLGFFEAVELIEKTIQTAKRIPRFDCSSGAWDLSLPSQHFEEAEAEASQQLPPVGPILRVHQVGKRVVSTMPDTALLGVLVLVSNELIRREYDSKSTTLPAYIRDLANSTLSELDLKLETLSELEWSVNDFIRRETDALSIQPLELVDFMDKYLMQDILPQIDKELSPFLSTLIADPREVQKITTSIKNLVQLATLVLIKPKENGLEAGWFSLGDLGGGRGDDKLQGDTAGGSTPSTSFTSIVEKGADYLLEGVDEAGSAIERLLSTWNGLVSDAGGLLKTKSFLSGISHNYNQTHNSDAVSNVSIATSSPFLPIQSTTMSSSIVPHVLPPVTGLTPSPSPLLPEANEGQGADRKSFWPSPLTIAQFARARSGGVHKGGVSSVDPDGD